MQKMIRGRLYDTETAELVGKTASGCYGDPTGYEERLYRTPDGYFFLYGIGVEQSPFPTEKLVCCSRARAKSWLEAPEG